MRRASKGLAGSSQKERSRRLAVLTSPLSHAGARRHFHAPRWSTGRADRPPRSASRALVFRKTPNLNKNVEIERIASRHVAADPNLHGRFGAGRRQLESLGRPLQFATEGGRVAQGKQLLGSRSGLFLRSVPRSRRPSRPRRSAHGPFGRRWRPRVFIKDQQWRQR